MGQNWTVPAGTYRYIAMDTYFEERSQSIDSNSTVLYWAIRGWDTSGSDAYWFSYAVNVGSLVINGTTVFNRTGNEEVLISIGTDTSASKKKIIASGTITIPHNSDGSKDCNTSFSLHPRWNQADYDWKNTKTLELTDIPRASTFTISDTTVNFGDKVDFTITRAVSTFTHKLKYSIGSANGTIASDVATSASWTIPNDLMKQVTSATSGKITITCETYSGSELIGSKTATITASVPASIVPSLNVTIAEGASIPSALSGVYIQGYSKLKVTSSATSQYGATIKDYAVTVENKTYSGSTVLSAFLTSSGTVAVKVVVTDSRGRSTTKITDVSVLAYNKPRITKITAYRTASSTSTTEDKQGAYIYIKPSGSIVALSNKNAKRCVVYYKKRTDSAYTSKTITLNDYVLDTEYTIVAADVGSDYDIYCVLSDSLDETKYISPGVLSASAYIHIPGDRRGIGFGKRLDDDIAGFDCGWDARFVGAVYGGAASLTDLPTKMSSGDDANDYLSCGTFAIDSNDIASSIANLPSPYAGTLQVQNANGRIISDANFVYLLQRYIPYQAKFAVYTRHITRGTNNAWTYSEWYPQTLQGLNKVLPDALASLGQNVLWSGYLSMTASDTASLTANISDQPSGIMLVWTVPDSSGDSSKDYGYIQHFVSKKFVSLHSTKGSNFWLSHLNSHVAYKYLYITDTTITGNNSNTASGTASNGITYNNAFWKLRYVIGV